MKRIITLTVFVIFSILLINSCKKNPTSSDKGVIMPLAVGNNWAYDDGTKILILSTTEIGDETWYINNYDEYWRNDSEGLWIYDVGEQREGLFIKYPIDINESYMGYDGLSVRCTSKGVAFVNYNNCYEYYISESEDGAIIEIRYYFKPDIGLVGMVIQVFYSGQIYNDIMVLESYTLN